MRKGSLLVKVAKDVQYGCPMNCANKLTGRTANAMSGIQKEQRAKKSALLSDIGQDHYDTFPVDPPRAQDILKAIGSAQIDHVMNNGEATKSYFVFKKILDFEEWRTPTIKTPKVFGCITCDYVDYKMAFFTTEGSCNGPLLENGHT